VAIHLLPVIGCTHPVTHHIRLVWRKIHRIHEEEEIPREPARPIHRPIRRKEDECADDGRHHHRSIHHRAHLALWQDAQHLPAAHDRHHRMAVFPRIPRRLHQGVQEKQRWVVTQAENSRPGDHRPGGGTHLVGKPRCQDQRDHHHRARARESGGPQIGGREVACDHHPLCENPQP